MLTMDFGKTDHINTHQWINIYHEGSRCTIHFSKYEADEYATNDRLACIRFGIGEGITV